MSKPEQHGMYYPLPTRSTVHKTRCIELDIPDDDQYEALLRGALLDLTKWYKYARDDAHLGAIVAKNWWVTFDSLRPCTPPDNIGGFDEDMTSICESLRFHNGVLQALCCGTWEDIAGQAAQGIGGPGQPGGGSSIPAPGQCQTYHAVLNGKDQWQAPPVVNAGDTVQISNLSGAWADGAGLFYCPVGSVFFAGNCTVTTLDALDPLPSQGHMALLSKIAGVFTNVSAGGLITVPGGVVNALLIFQANDHTLSDNGGEITFDVTICNGMSAIWESTLDFTINPYAFVEDHPPTGAVWVAGVGWQVTNNAGGGNFNSDLEITLTSCTITHIELTTLSASYVAPSTNIVRAVLGTTTVINPAVVAGSGVHTTSYDNLAGITTTDMDIRQFDIGSGTITYQRMIIRGLGAKPPELP